jgi:hypothetical protein
VNPLPLNPNSRRLTPPMVGLLFKWLLFKPGQHTRANPPHSTSGNPFSRSLALSFNARHFARLQDRSGPNRPRGFLKCAFRLLASELL